MGDGCPLCGFERERDPSEWLYQDDLWSVGKSYWSPTVSPIAIIPGMVTIQLRRHARIFEVRDDEWSTLGPLIGRVAGAVQGATEAECVYFVALGEGYPHFHINFIPRGEDVPKEERGIGLWQELYKYVDDDAVPVVGDQVRALLAGD